MTKISDLPQDVESNILSRIPIECRPKLQMSCKRWFELLKQRKMVVLMNYTVYSVRYNPDDPSIELTGNLKALNGSPEEEIKINRMFCCDGLVLLQTMGIIRLVVWNPCTGATKWIERPDGYSPDDAFGFGYYENSETNRREYKILRMFRYKKEVEVDVELDVTGCEVYEFRSDSWRVLDDIHSWYLASFGVSLRGNAYWIAKEEGEDEAATLLGFDFATERFGDLPLPYDNYEYDYEWVLSVVGDEQLSVLTLFPNEMKIWVTNKIVGPEDEEVEWSEFLSVDFTDKRCPSRQKHIRAHSFWVDEENELILYCDEVAGCIHIVGNDIRKLLYQNTTETLSPTVFGSYVPSLLPLQQEDTHPKA